MNYVLKNEFYEATFSARGAEMISLKNSEGFELLWQNNTGKGWADHAPLLFPFCGRLKDNTFFYQNKPYPMGLHGFASKTEFELAESSDSKITFVLNSNEETKAIFPFDFSFFVTYSFDADKIKLTVNVKNTGESELPFVFGWHPGFVLPTDKGQDIEDYAIKFDNKKEVTWVHFYNDYSIPSDLVPYEVKNSEYKLCEEEIYKYDTMIFLDTGTSVKLKADGYPFELSMSWSENLPVLCIWKAANHDSKFICIEPWTHMSARGENNNVLEYRPMNRLLPGESESYEYNIKFSF